MEDSHSLAPYTMRFVEGSDPECSHIVTLVELAERAVATAGFMPQEPRGAHFLHLLDYVKVFPGDGDAQQLSLTRSSHEGDRYKFTDPSGIATETTLTEDSTAIAGEGAARIADLGAAIVRCEAVGSYARRIFKELSSPLIRTAVFVEVTYVGGPNRLFPLTLLDLTLFRPYGEDAGGVAQSSRVLSDPDTGRVWVGNLLEVELWELHGEGADGISRVRHPLPEVTAAGLEERFHPLTPVDKPIDATAWQRLITQPIDPREQLQD